MKKIVIPALVAGFAVSMAIGYLFMFLVPSLNDEYKNTCMFRPWDDPLMMLYFLHPVYIAFILSWAWDKTKSLITGSIANRAICFTIAIFLLATLPGMLMSISSFKISGIMVLSWIISSFLQTFAIALVVGKMNK
jgi:hypothetical protein